MGRIPGTVKWLLAPALAAFFGYAVIGPRMAGKVKKAVQEQVGKLAPDAEGPATPPPPATTVEARPLAETRPEEKEPRPRRRRRHAEP